MSSYEPRYGTIDREYSMRLESTPPEEDGPVWVVNLMKYREVADYGDGSETAISGQEADDLYSPFESLNVIGAEVAFFGDVDQQLLGDGTVWDRIAVVKYPTRRSIIDMQALPEFQETHKHKEAGMEKTFVIGCQPMTGLDTPSDFQPVDWADVPHPPTDDDGPVIVLHVLRYEDAAAADQTPAHMEAYQSAAAVAASKHGARISGWFAVEGTMVGDGRTWHQVRFNLFPSKAAFMAVVADPARLEAQKAHREVAIADTYTMIVRPAMNRLEESIGA